MFFYNWSPATWKTQKLASHMVPHGPMGLSLLEISQLRHGSVHLFDVDLWDHLGLGQSWEQNWIKLGQRYEASWIIYDALFGVAESTGISHDWTHPLASCKAPEKALKNKAKAQSKLPLFEPQQNVTRFQTESSISNTATMVASTKAFPPLRLRLLALSEKYHRPQGIRKFMFHS